MQEGESAKAPSGVDCFGSPFVHGLLDADATPRTRGERSVGFPTQHVPPLSRLNPIHHIRSKNQSQLHEE